MAELCIIASSLRLPGRIFATGSDFLSLPVPQEGKAARGLIDAAPGLEKSMTWEL